MGPRYAYLLRLTLLVGDCFMVNMAFLISNLFLPLLGNTVSGNQPLIFLFIFNATWLFSAFLMKLYSYSTLQKVENIFRQTIKTSLLHFGIFISIVAFSGDVVMQHYLKFLAVTGSILIFFFTISRFIVTYVSDFFLKSIGLKKRITIIGYNDTGIKLAEFFSQKRGDYSFHGFFDDENSGGYVVNSDGRIEGQIEQCVDYAVKNQIDEIYSTIMPGHEDSMRGLVEVADQRCVRLKFVANTDETILDQYHLNYVGDFPVITLRKEPLDDIGNRIKKRIFDIAFSFVVTLLLLSWLIPIIGLLIKLDSKGPVFFRQNRAGRNNRVFGIWKFRTMRVTESDTEFKQAQKNDPRVTRVGKFLRKSNLDEVPQFLNVLFGDMSITGPRPHPIKLNETYMDSISSYMARHFVKPGITGWAQVNGYRGETEAPHLMQKRIEHDIWYVENWSLMLDIRIIFLTIINIFKGEEKAY
ncbi:undecaprenyl-phosphate glucose phosphotransferase [Foetidibacter luteolus]|uniref:undecaprenyl-phosphate glucose phosphotransferase n=1 Tax=Foetidibacter luteolus TaxID=2608880 RepID=UPI001A983C43|nr:undecaprenyl-phosphate glucose phosphotransferase [Foetidibacter luteolus]